MRTSLALVLLLVVSACALPQQRSRQFTPYQPLEAYITATTATGGPLFHVNRPAYVAMFYIVPGRGVSMLYPGFGSGSLSGRVFAGSHFASSRLSNGRDYIFTAGSYGQPRYYFLIASDRPLNVQQFGSFGDGLRSRLGTSFASYSAYAAMEDLARLTLPHLAEEGSWTTDMYVEWPSVIFRDPGQGRVLLRCGGYEMFVSRAYLATVQSVICERNVDQLPESGDDDGEADEEAVKKAGTREPLPADPRAGEGGRTRETRAITSAQRQALVDRLTASTQLEAPKTRPTYAGAGQGGESAFDARGRQNAGMGASSSSGSRGVTSAASRPPASSVGSRPASAAPAGGSARAPAALPSSPPSSSGSSGGAAPSRSRPTPSSD